MNRLILKKLVFTGTDKLPASIDLLPGFNVISGPSNTGKSLIYECINYALGGGSKPKEPPEAKGYTNLFLTASCGDKEFTIERSILSNDVRIYEAHFDDIDEETETVELSSSANANNNLSDYLLNLIDIGKKKLKKNERNETINLTFNVLRNLVLVDEGKIQAKSSPILTENVTTATSEKALFRFLITGIDYSNIIVQQKPEIRKADATARINLLNQLIKNSSLDLKNDTTRDELERQKEKLENSIETEIKSVSSSHSEIEELQNSRKSAWNTVLSSESKIDQLNEILNRFNLLASHYQSDLERLDAIIETGEFLSLSADIHCPLCGATPEHHKPDCVISESEIGNVQSSCDQEKLKIKTLQSDLDKTISQVREELQEFIERKHLYESTCKNIDKLLHDKLEPSVSKRKGYLKELFDTKKDVEIMINLMGQVIELKELKSTAEKDLKSKQKIEKIPTGVQAAEIEGLIKTIENTLAEWGFPNLGRIGFSEILQDITIGSKNRSDEGKGYRAITNAAFIISLMEFCVGMKKPHPGFVVLDSPLVTFRGADKIVDKKEAIPDDMKEMFYSSLSKLPDDRQVIVIENDDPPKDVQDKIHYIHFTKDTALGRYGFIPVE